MSRTPISRRAANRLLLGTAAVICLPQPGAAFSYLPREAWNARDPAFGMPRHDPRRITIHHTAVRSNPSRSLASKLASLQRFSQRRERLANGAMKEAWADLPYHYYIDVSGEVGEGRDPNYAGDTNTNYDPTGHIAVVLEGNFEIERPSAAQLDALAEVLGWLMQQHSVDPSLIGTHNAFAATACPGRNLMAELPAVLARAGTGGGPSVRPARGQKAPAGLRPQPRPAR